MQIGKSRMRSHIRTYTRASKLSELELISCGVCSFSVVAAAHFLSISILIGMAAWW